MDDLPSGLSSKTTYAALSPSDLKSLGKTASLAYLRKGIPLNDAVIKLAREYPSISPHQVRRIAEFANQETFGALFDDGEKYANDKNVEFDVADPGNILRELDNGCRPVAMSAEPEDYANGPIKTAHQDVIADVLLCRAFGVEPATPVLVKTAQAKNPEVEQHAGALSRILGHEKAAMIGSMGPDGQVAPTATGGGSDAEHHDRMLEVQREIELAKKRQELMKVQQQTQEMAAPPGMEQAPEAASAPVGPPPPDQAAAAQGQMMAPDQMAMAQQGGAPAGAPPEGVPPEQMPPEQMPPEQMPEAAAPAMVPPGSEMPKMSALLNQAIRYVKSDRPKTASVAADLEKATSLDRIKEALAAKRVDYPNADPFRDLYVAKTKVAAVVDELSRKRDLNTYLYKEAKNALAHEVEQHLWEGGNLGEVSHLMASVGSAPGVKHAMAGMIPTLVRRGLDLPAAQAELAQYELEKKGSVRVPNTDHPIAQAYAAMCKLARDQSVLTTALSEAESKLSELQETIKEAGAADLALRAASYPVRTALANPGKALGVGMVGMGAPGTVSDAQTAAKTVNPAPWRVQ